MSIPSRLQDRILVLSHKKQTNFATILPDADLQAGKTVPAAATIFGQPEPQWWTDRELAYKGHDFPTRSVETMREISDQYTFAGDSYLAAWAAVFGMGKITSVQPNAGGNPTAWRHTIKFMNPTTDGLDLPVTTGYVEASGHATLKRRLKALAIRQFNYEFPAAGPISIAAAIQGSGEITTGALASPPALMTLNLLNAHNTTFSYGPQAAPVDVTSEIVRGSVRFSAGWGIDDEHSRHPGSGLFRTRAWVTRTELSLEFQRFVDDASSTPFDDWIADTAREVKVKVEGAVIGSGPEKHDLEIRGLAVRPRAQRIGEINGKAVYQYSIPAEGWFKEGSADVVTVIVTNTQASYLT